MAVLQICSTRSKPSRSGFQHLRRFGVYGRDLSQNERGALLGSMMADVFGGMGGLISGAVLEYAVYSAEDSIVCSISQLKKLRQWSLIISFS